jgi:hypothetical protein
MSTGLLLSLPSIGLGTEGSPLPRAGEALGCSVARAADSLCGSVSSLPSYWLQQLWEKPIEDLMVRNASRPPRLSGA